LTYTSTNDQLNLELIEDWNANAQQCVYKIVAGSQAFNYKSLFCFCG
jgi:hypothetical protein